MKSSFVCSFEKCQNAILYVDFSIILSQNVNPKKVQYKLQKTEQFLQPGGTSRNMEILPNIFFVGP